MLNTEYMITHDEIMYPYIRKLCKSPFRYEMKTKFYISRLVVGQNCSPQSVDNSEP